MNERVYVQTNDAETNAVIAFDRSADGRLEPFGRYETGGRGTGKSTILEYLRWGLCDQPVDNTDSDIAPVQIKRKK